MDKRTKAYRDSVKNEVKSKRRTRVGFGGHRTRLQLSDAEYNKIIDDGFVPYWFNDDGAKIQEALAAGYEFVRPEEATSIGQGEIHQDNTDLGSKVSKVVSRSGPEIRAFLMKTRKEFYDEDAASRESKNAQVDEALRAGHPGGAEIPNQYVPEGGGVSITRD